ncbi:hypothetical protein VISI1226_07453 [Vibrio sinaloensis DSM 21326]|uniref:Uncharacterized protein n=1 Tax=Vibrio sinaloensis DSM 21326 TaxID=945550 RepID=E8MAH5_PHOS4|nr:hypothetical protein [Vibrio sinaloensis]EGA69124.1 hypothetical protein VISI1226_07453 [Vibrio sinaloensis DSM 21326]
MYAFSLSGKNFWVRLQIFLMVIEKALAFIIKGEAYWIGKIDQPKHTLTKNSALLPVKAKLYELHDIDKIQVHHSTQ